MLDLSKGGIVAYIKLLLEWTLLLIPLLQGHWWHGVDVIVVRDAFLHYWVSIILVRCAVLAVRGLEWRKGWKRRWRRKTSLLDLHVRRVIVASLEERPFVNSIDALDNRAMWLGPDFLNLQMVHLSIEYYQGTAKIILFSVTIQLIDGFKVNRMYWSTQ